MCILIFEVVIDDEINIFSTFAPCKTMRNVKLQNQQIRAICLLILFLGYQLSVSAFTHLHIIDGVSVVHSHPFQKSFWTNISCRECGFFAEPEYGFLFCIFFSDFSGIMELFRIRRRLRDRAFPNAVRTNFFTLSYRRILQQ